MKTNKYHALLRFVNSLWILNKFLGKRLDRENKSPRTSLPTVNLEIKSSQIKVGSQYLPIKNIKQTE